MIYKYKNYIIEKKKFVPVVIHGIFLKTHRQVYIQLLILNNVNVLQTKHYRILIETNAQSSQATFCEHSYY